MKKIKILLIGTLLMLMKAHALEVKDSNQVVLVVNGLVCSFCAFGMSKNLSKLKFVNNDLFEKGVHTDIEKGFVTLALDPSQSIDFLAIRKKVIKGGYELKGIHMKLSGIVSKSSNRVTIQDKASNQMFELVDYEGKPFNPVVDINKEMTIQGFISDANVKEYKDGQPIRVRVKSDDELNERESGEIENKKIPNHKH